MKNINMTDDVMIKKLRLILNILNYTDIKFDNENAINNIVIYCEGFENNNYVYNLYNQVMSKFKID